MSNLSLKMFIRTVVICVAILGIKIIKSEEQMPQNEPFQAEVSDERGACSKVDERTIIDQQYKVIKLHIETIERLKKEKDELILSYIRQFARSIQLEKQLLAEQDSTSYSSILLAGLIPVTLILYFRYNL